MQVLLDPVDPGFQGGDFVLQVRDFAPFDPFPDDRTEQLVHGFELVAALFRGGPQFFDERWRDGDAGILGHFRALFWTTWLGAMDKSCP